MLRPESRTTSIDSSENISLFARIETPRQPRGCVVITHGFGEHIGRYEKLADRFADMNLVVARYDMRGMAARRANAAMQLATICI